MRKFTDLGINTEVKKGLVGDRIKTERVLDKEITILYFEITESKFEGRCLRMQIQLKEEKRVIFTSARRLIEIMEKVRNEDLPFTTTIKKLEDDTFQFT